MKHLEKYLSILMLSGAVVFNLWLYRLEPAAKIDPNDNAFQFALVERTNQIWNFAAKKCSANLICRASYLIDHWVPNWAEGYNLPYYYSHIPQIIIVASYRLLSNLSLITYHLSLFEYYHLTIYFLLALFPLSVFWALRVIGLPWLGAGIGALLATQISTDGLYGLDPASFLWRGYGLSSQLFAMIFLPQAIAYSWKYFNCDKRYVISDKQNIKKFFLSPVTCHLSLPVFFLAATTAGHLGIGIIAILSLIPLALGQPILNFLVSQKFGNEGFKHLKENLLKFILLAGTTIFFLSYWIVPILLNGNYHNISFWDPVWKFNSYGAKEIMIRFLNGDLFDFGRFPVFTLLIITGLFSAASKKIFAAKKFIYEQQYVLFPFSLLFIFWLFLYFGRTTWEGLIDLVPGMKDFHLSRFIVGLHLAGLFLAPIGLIWIIDNLSLVACRLSHFNHSLLRLFAYSLIILFTILTVYPQTIKYNDLNNKLIVQANGNYDKVKPNIDELFQTLRNLGEGRLLGRIFAGRGGSWGKAFKAAETPLYMQLSTYGFPTVLWLPETWSPNSDVEQFFREDKAQDYDLFNISHVVAPPGQPTQPFWKLLKTNPFWKLYEVKTNGYITSGILPAVVSTDSRSYVNLVHQWIQSDNHLKGLYPQLTFDRNYPKITGLPNFKMIDEANYIVPDNSLHNIFKEPPLYLPPDSEALKLCNNVTISNQKNDSDMVFSATVSKKDNNDCLIILKQSSHPDWQVTVDGKPAAHLNVFPFFTAVTLNEPGTHKVIFSYEPSPLKVVLIIIELTAVVYLLLQFILKLFKK